MLATVERPHHGQYFAWWDAYAREREEDPQALRFFVAYAGEEPVAILPLALRQQRVSGVPLRALEIPDGGSPTREPVLGGGAPARLVASFAEYLGASQPEGWDVLALRALPESSAAWRSLTAVAPRRLIVEDSGGCDFLPCVSREERLAGLSKNFRGALRKARNKLAQQPGVEFVRARTPAEIEAAVAEFLAVEGSGWKGSAGSAVASHARKEAFLRGVARRFAAVGCAEVNLLRAEGTAIAAQFCVRVGRRLTIEKIGYDERYARLAPGNMLLEHVLDRCHAEGDVDEVDLVSDAPWHRPWKASSRRRLTALVFSASARGRAAWALGRGKELLRPAVRGLRGLAARSGRGTAAAEDE